VTTASAAARAATTLDVTATPCRHGPPLSRPVADDVVGFALRRGDAGDGVIWISGDTVLYEGVRQVARRLRVDIALLHLGGVRFPISGPLRYPMTAREAGRAVRPAPPARSDADSLRGLEALSRGARGDRTRGCARAGHIRKRIRWLPIGVAMEVGT
jgi:hypothetical protein